MEIRFANLLSKDNCVMDRGVHVGIGIAIGGRGKFSVMIGLLIFAVIIEVK